MIFQRENILLQKGHILQNGDIFVCWLVFIVNLINLQAHSEAWFALG